MPRAAVAADLDEPLDVHRDLLAEIALDAALLFDDAADLAHVLFGEVLHADVGVHAGVRQNVVRALAADPVDVSEANLDALGARQIDACDASHELPLPLLVFLIRADHAHDATTAHDLALVANPLHGRPNLHDLALPHNPAPPRILRAELHRHAIPDDEPDEIARRARTGMRRDFVPALDRHPVERPRQHRQHRTRHTGRWRRLADQRGVPIHG